MASEAIASAATAIVQISDCSGNAVTRSRYIRASPATFVAAPMKAVTEVGAPWYTSGVHMWNGAAETLKPSPARIIAIPVTKSGSSAPVASWIAENPSSPVAPYTSAQPKSRIPEPKLPTMRYLRPASSDCRRWVSSAQRT